MQNQIITAWKKLHKEKTNTASSTLTYILLRAGAKHEGFFERELTPEEIDTISTEAIFYIRRAFKPCTNPVKLANGRKAYDILDRYDIMIPYARNKATMSEAHKAYLERHFVSRLAPFEIQANPIINANLFNLYALIMKRIGL